MLFWQPCSVILLKLCWSRVSNPNEKFALTKMVPAAEPEHSYVKEI